MQEEKIPDKSSSNIPRLPYSQNFQFYSENGLPPFKKLKTDTNLECMDEEPLFQSRELGTTSQREIEGTRKKSPAKVPRQSFDSVFPKGRYESELPGLHQTHILLRKQGEANKYAKVYKAIDLADCTVKALKVVTGRFPSKLGSSASKPPFLEAVILEKLSNMGANVPKFHDSWIEKNKRIIKMEFCQSTLAEAMMLRHKFNKQYSEIEILQLMLDVVPVVYQLHSLNYAHLDIKPGRN